MAFAQSGSGNDGEARAKELAQLLGAGEMETADATIAGRLKIISKPKAAREVEIARGRSGSWLYDVNRHLNLCAALRREYTSFAFFLAENAARASISAEAATQKCDAGGNVVIFPRAMT